MWGRVLVWAETTMCRLRYVRFVFLSGTRASRTAGALQGLLGSGSIRFEV